MINEEKGLVVVMIQYFELFKLKDKDLFDCIFYLVLNGFYDEQNLRDEIVEVIFIFKEKMRNEKLKKYIKIICFEDRL